VSLLQPGQRTLVDKLQVIKNSDWEQNKSENGHAVAWDTLYDTTW
jgi:hypothetical protein